MTPDPQAKTSEERQMTYTNVNIDTEFSQRTQWSLERTKLETELMFYRTLYRDMCNSFENIPRAIEQYGHIDLSIDGNDKIRLVLEHPPAKGAGGEKE